jgi:hypothetical protein
MDAALDVEVEGGGAGAPQGHAVAMDRDLCHRGGKLEPVDRVALGRLAETMIADPRERVAVSFVESRRRG